MTMKTKTELLIGDPDRPTDQDRVAARKRYESDTKLNWEYLTARKKKWLTEDEMHHRHLAQVPAIVTKTATTTKQLPIQYQIFVDLLHLLPAKEAVLLVLPWAFVTRTYSAWIGATSNASKATFVHSLDCSNCWRMLRAKAIARVIQYATDDEDTVVRPYFKEAYVLPTSKRNMRTTVRTHAKLPLRALPQVVRLEKTLPWLTNSRYFMGESA